MLPPEAARTFTRPTRWPSRKRRVRANEGSKIRKSWFLLAERQEIRHDVHMQKLGLRCPVNAYARRTNPGSCQPITCQESPPRPKDFPQRQFNQFYIHVLRQRVDRQWQLTFIASGRDFASQVNCLLAAQNALGYGFATPSSRWQQRRRPSATSHLQTSACGEQPDHPQRRLATARADMAAPLQDYFGRAVRGGRKAA